MTDICRLCLSIISSPSIPAYKGHILLEDQIKYLLPEIDISLIPTFDLCNLCIHLLSAAYIFKRGCLKTEETIKKYVSQHNNIPIDLHEVKKLKNGDFSLIPDLLEVKIEPLYVEIPTRTNTDVREQLSVTFSCNECQETFGDEEILKKHQKECISYNCNQSEKSVVIKDEYNTHHESHSIHGMQSSSISSKPFQQGTELDVHNLQFPIKKSTICDICLSVFSSQMELQSHKVSHETSPKEYCDPYNKKFSQWLLTDNAEQSLHTCQTCGVTYKYKSTLTRHIHSEHGIERPYRCQICGMHFNQESYLTKHKLFKHEKDRPYRCQRCGMSFIWNSELVSHIQSKHEMDQLYKCKICDKSFAESLLLLVHTETHTKPDERFFECSYAGCNKRFKREKDCAYHLRRHTMGKPHKCESCGKAFADRISLTMHLTLHTGERPFQCHLCDKAFRWKNTLKMHLKSCGGNDQNFEIIKVEETKIMNEQFSLSS